MSRPKSPESVQADIDKAIRKERRERKRKERGARRKERERRRVTRERVIQNNGIPKVQSGGQHLGIRDAIESSHHTHILCPNCLAVVFEVDVIAGQCQSCRYGKEVVDNPEYLKAKKGDDAEGGPCGRPSAHEERRTA